MASFLSRCLIVLWLTMRVKSDKNFYQWTNNNVMLNLACMRRRAFGDAFDDFLIKF